MKTQEHTRKSVSVIFSLFVVAILLISALTSFAFFYTFLPGLVPEGMIDGTLGRIVSGIIGVLLLDVATVVWLSNFLHNSETSEQRGIALIMTIITFIGSATASIAYIGLSGQNELSLAGETRATIGIASLFMVIGAIILNFAATQFHTRFSLESKQAVLEADRRDRLQTAEAENARHLDGLVEQSLKKQFQDLAPELAKTRARDLAHKMYSNEMTKVTQESVPSNTIIDVDIDPAGENHRMDVHPEDNIRPKV
jgi:heme/copper-type cytochrome/quinol oxidase subunit 3